MGNWDSERQSEPEPPFTLTKTPSYQQYRLKQFFFLKYVKTIHGRDTAAKVRMELDSLKITEQNFHQWKEASLQKAMDKIENPPENLLRHH